MLKQKRKLLRMTKLTSFFTLTSKLDAKRGINLNFLSQGGFKLNSRVVLSLLFIFLRDKLQICWSYLSSHNYQMHH